MFYSNCCCVKLYVHLTRTTKADMRNKVNNLKNTGKPVNPNCKSILYFLLVITLTFSQAMILPLNEDSISKFSWREFANIWIKTIYQAPESPLYSLLD